MTEVGTLKELNVKPGDVVEVVKGPYRIYDYIGVEWKVFERHPLGHCGVHCACYDRGHLDNGYMCADDCRWTFRIIYRASDPKLWKDMTPEEKGALLLAHYEGKVIEYFSKAGPPEWVACNPTFADEYAYRIIPEPKIETVTVYGAPRHQVQWCYEKCVLDTHRITFNLIDGKPDCTSVKMEPLA